MLVFHQQLFFPPLLLQSIRDTYQDIAAAYQKNAEFSDLTLAVLRYKNTDKPNLFVAIYHRIDHKQAADPIAKLTPAWQRLVNVSRRGKDPVRFVLSTY